MHALVTKSARPVGWHSDWTTLAYDKEVKAAHCTLHTVLLVPASLPKFFYHHPLFWWPVFHTMLTGASVNDTTGSSRSETVHPELISLVNKVKEGAAIEEDRWTDTDARTMLATLNSLWMEAKGNGTKPRFMCRTFAYFTRLNQRIHRWKLVHPASGPGQ